MSCDVTRYLPPRCSSSLSYAYVDTDAGSIHIRTMSPTPTHGHPATHRSHLDTYVNARTRTSRRSPHTQCARVTRARNSAQQCTSMPVCAPTSTKGRRCGCAQTSAHADLCRALASVFRALITSSEYLAEPEVPDARIGLFAIPHLRWPLTLLWASWQDLGWFSWNTRVHPPPSVVMSCR